ncbi:MAG: ABC transporter ATP-binding protein [Chloroflexota bacterium]
MAEILAAHSLRKVFQAGGENIGALVGVDLHIDPGEFVVILGPSGSGKSTLLHLLGGLDSPTEGSVTLDGVELFGLGDRDLTRVRRDKTGFVFQFFNLLPALNVYENIALPFFLGGQRPRAEQIERVEDMLQLFSLKAVQNRPVTDLSAGEQQRTALARAFVTEPSVVLADEPTGSLDVRTGTEILQLLWESCDNLKQTILVVTHDPKVAAFGDRVLFIRDGEMVDELVLGRREDHSDTGAITSRLEELSL